MSRVLIAYASNAGSTKEVADSIGSAMGKAGDQVDVRPIDSLASVDGYEAVLVGGPMMFGWHRAARSFVSQHERSLARVPVAYFLMASSLTDTKTSVLDGIPVVIDPNLPKAPKNDKRLNVEESFATVASYMRPVLRAAPTVKPVSIAFFGGKIDLSRLKLWQKLFLTVAIRAKPGDRRNWSFIEQWACTWRSPLETSPVQHSG